jgi:hypothetical protein
MIGEARIINLHFPEGCRYYFCEEIICGSARRGRHVAADSSSVFRKRAKVRQLRLRDGLLLI